MAFHIHRGCLRKEKLLSSQWKWSLQSYVNFIEKLLQITASNSSLNFVSNQIINNHSNILTCAQRISLYLLKYKIYTCDNTIIIDEVFQLQVHSKRSKRKPLEKCASALFSQQIQTNRKKKHHKMNNNSKIHARTKTNERKKKNLPMEMMVWLMVLVGYEKWDNTIPSQPFQLCHLR